MINGRFTEMQSEKNFRHSLFNLNVRQCLVLTTLWTKDANEQKQIKHVQLRQKCELEINLTKKN